MVSSKNKNTPINENIRAEEVMLIGANGDKVGLMSLSEALESARAASLDLCKFLRLTLNLLFVNF